MDAMVREPVLDSVRTMLRGTLMLGDRAAALGPSSGLFGTIPEFDSMAVVTVITAIEERFGIVIDDEDITAELFGTVGSLVAYIEGRLAC